MQLVARVDIRHVQFDNRALEDLDRVHKRDGTERIASRIKDNRIRAFPRGLDMVDQCPLAIGLHEFDFGAQDSCKLTTASLD